MVTTQLPIYLTEREVSEMTKISVSSLQKGRFTGNTIPYVKIARSVRYSLADVLAFMEQHKVQPHA